MMCALVAVGCLLLAQEQQGGCEELQAMIADTYTFKPSQLSSAQKDEASEGMDRVWTYVTENPAETTECLRAALNEGDANAWFLFDGSALLVKVDPSPESKALQARLWCSADLADIHEQYWLETLARLGSEGFDVTVAAERWLADEDSEYVLPRHGLFVVGPAEGAMFLFGSMDEAFATPALLRIVQTADHRGRDVALQLLEYQGTPDAWRAIAELDEASVQASRREALLQLRRAAPTIPTGEPGVELSRDQLLSDLHAFLGDETATRLSGGLLETDWLINAVRQLQPEDVDLLRRARRRRVTISSDEAVYEYVKYSRAIQALTWSPEFFEN